MDNGRISARYAKALYGYAVDRKKEENIYEEMKLISEVFFLVPHLTTALSNPRISSDTKKELIINAAGSNVSPEFKRFLNLVIKQKRESYFHFISLVYQDIYRKAKNLVVGKLTTAQPINPAQEEAMQKTLAEKTGSNVDFASKVEPAIIGGFILQVGTYQIDASLSNQLKKIKDSLLQKNSLE